MKRFLTRRFALLWAMACLAAAVVTAWPGARLVRTDDSNADGRPDVWRQYDSAGQLTGIDRDRNFDGLPDVRESYEHGVLVRRSSDRNFDRQIDLVEEFDAATREETRSVTDVDYDGRADLLVLFRAGVPVFTRRAGPPASEGDAATRRTVRSVAGPAGWLVAFIDPFASDLALRNGLTAAVSVGAVQLPSAARPAIPRDGVGIIARASEISALDSPPAVSAAWLPPAPRGPPVS